MDQSDQTSDEVDEFFDALDDFPFFDCILADQSEQSVSESKEIPSNLRRRSFSHRRAEIDASKGIIGEKTYKVYRNLKENETNLIKSESTGNRVDSQQLGGNVSGEKNEESTVTIESDKRVVDSVDSVDSLVADEPPQSSSFLLSIAGLLIKAIGFQFNLIICFILFPFTIFSYSCMLIIHPFGTMKLGRDYLLRKLYDLWNLICGCVSSWSYESFKGHESMWKLVSRYGWGLFWAIYVCSILCGLLVFSIVISGVLVRSLVEEPIQIKEMLDFDYTKNSPVAFVPIKSCDGALSGFNCEEKKEFSRVSGSRVIPVNHKVQVTVKLIMPESDYNRKLGIFQVRVELLSINGARLSTSSHHCMLQFKSEPVRHLLTFFKVAPIVVGYASETQTLNVKFKGFVEGNVPTACLKVMIERRAEFQPGAGIPEIYDASLILESELPLFRRIIWSWKKTIFVWMSMTSFMMQLIFALICCRPLILPRPRRREGSSSSSIASQNGSPSQTQLRPPLQQT